MPLHSIAELIALAKQQTGKLNFASTGTGTSTHLAAELFAAMAGVKLTAIPYKGVAPAVTDLMGGYVDLMFCPTASVVGLVRDGKLRALAVTGAKRSPLFPQLPTVAEAGLPGYGAELHYGIVAPAGTPPPVIAALNAALNDALADADVRSRLGSTAPNAAGHAGGLRRRYRRRTSQMVRHHQRVRRNGAMMFFCARTGAKVPGRDAASRPIRPGIVVYPVDPDLG